MLFRAATRALPAARVAQRRAMSSAAAGADKKSFFKKWIVGMPVDVYPLATVTICACSGSAFMIYKHLTEDSARGELRLLPDRYRS